MPQKAQVHLEICQASPLRDMEESVSDFNFKNNK